MSPRTLTVSLLWLLVCLPILILPLIGMDAAARLYYSNAAQLLTALVAFLLCMRTAWRLPQTEPMRLTWSLIALAVIAWGIGQALFFSYPILNSGEETPYPWWGDVGYLLMPPLLITALIQFIRDMQTPLPLWGILAGLATGIAGFVFAAFGNWEDLGGEGLLLPLAAVGYMTFDPVLIGITVITASILGSSPAGRAWWYVVAGVFCYYVANVFYSYFNGLGTYETGMISDIGWPLGFGCIAVAALVTDELFSE